MTPTLRCVHGVVLGAALAVPQVSLAGEGFRGWSGGHWLRMDNCATIPKGAQPAPPGTYVNLFIKVQETNAETDDFVIHKHMWYKGGTELGPMGRYQLDQIVRRLPEVPFPVVIATSANDALDEARREVIINCLAARGIADPSRVIIAFPIAEGLYGEEAPRVERGIMSGINPFFLLGGGAFFGGGFPGFYGGGFGR